MRLKPYDPYRDLRIKLDQIEDRLPTVRSHKWTLVTCQYGACHAKRFGKGVVYVQAKHPFSYIASFGYKCRRSKVGNFLFFPTVKTQSQAMKALDAMYNTEN